MGASQPSARSSSATGLVARAAICIGCGLWSFTSPALAQAPAPALQFHSEPIQPWQGGEPVEFRQSCPVAFDKANPVNSALAKPAVSSNVEEQVLLPLLLEEKKLLLDYGPDHPEVHCIRERIQIVREHLARHPLAPPPSTLVPLPSISVQTPYRESSSTTASTSSAPRQTPPLPFPPVRSQDLQPGGTQGGTAAKDRDGNTQTMTSRGQPEIIRPAGFSTAGNPSRDAGTAPASLAATSPTVVKTEDKDTHPAALASTSPSAKAAVSPPRTASDHSASKPSQEQPRGNSFFDMGLGQIIGIVGTVLLGVLIHLIALVLILRRDGGQRAGVFRVELINPQAVAFVGQASAAGAQSVAAGPAIEEVPQSSTAEEEVPQSSTAETFDIGPTYEEEMRQKQEALNQQEQAVLQHIFELNMQVREQLSQLSSGAESKDQSGPK